MPVNSILKYVEDLVSSKADTGAILDKIVEKLKDGFPHYDWVGIYLVKNGRLELGPYRGKPSPHEVIELGKGICGAAVTEGSTIIVDDVNADPRYLACSIETRSEIVVPIFSKGKAVGEIDIDSHTRAAFTPQDRDLLEKIAALVSKRF